MSSGKFQLSEYSIKKAELPYNKKPVEAILPTPQTLQFILTYYKIDNKQYSANIHWT